MVTAIYLSQVFPVCLHLKGDKGTGCWLCLLTTRHCAIFGLNLLLLKATWLCNSLNATPSSPRVSVVEQTVDKQEQETREVSLVSEPV